MRRPGITCAMSLAGSTPAYGGPTARNEGRFSRPVIVGNVWPVPSPWTIGLQSRTAGDAATGNAAWQVRAFSRTTARSAASSGGDDLVGRARAHVLIGQ